MMGFDLIITGKESIEDKANVSFLVDVNDGVMVWFDLILNGVSTVFV